ncbi:NAD(P)H-hydrate epimerase [candidate division WOR-1 bacterium RIFOXYA12_FULL_52_29]|uniref:NAD(P)H-hydrate epimerase n=1 Tax=candidate division WOR-1 bacterium RIFOXYC12_FULL_54_18 TaxID=1802584 RepID=A0A1F4T7N8_UNCSA|nr:MAG: NAD(P)H-hydrate epimerase [candidate division WOR-1 bacterium RIFOXYA2_FULL_51_19]OGC18394.1 MAG: NAD(P)H-hydrate epimerase [candidate division WOR-1 bacterium RIFOXYA12_FULL_52_29]OGC27249.1 MAG: NAD(P)H-hydrate epimerase [candidate division WOR-1 bacterium RIFOXYB2_FULL_45_9]OGC28811.1 MAG: NAD(P)H-hydrate epimerase [candidate division WOR-1 bacterium RIFOXYC12_FULL_54_18]OGC30735.1 MAG: NAD(P)H-hydrate epimerase [candidate division WOR-1 bacterium RIFOXYB12_FULL_52_16]
MKTISVAQAKEFDHRAQVDFGVPSIVLMENAGRSAAEVALKMLWWRERAAVVCGVGNNGGDGLVAARHLYNQGKKVTVFVIGDHNRGTIDFMANLLIIEHLGLPIVWVKEAVQLEELSQAELVIDALFGLGLTTPVRQPAREMIETINSLRRPVLAVDLPSGLNADSGEVMGAAVKAKCTVTFIAMKKGFLSPQAKQYCGRIIVRDIGITSPTIR